MAPWDTVWIEGIEGKDSFLLQKTDGSTVHIKIGDWIKLPGREDAVMVDSIIKSEYTEESGPRGFTYLPWRYDEKRFATVNWNLKGNTRLVICYPCGRNHYGCHIDWDKLELGKPPNFTFYAVF